MGDPLQLALCRPIAFHRVFVSLSGSVCAGLFLSQLYYWSDRGKLPDGWVFKSQDEWEQETGLSKREQLTARRKLEELGLIEAQRKGRPAGSPMHYRVSREHVFQAIRALSDNSPQQGLQVIDSSTIAESANMESRYCTFAESAIPEERKARFHSLYTETTSENTTTTTNTTSTVTKPPSNQLSAPGQSGGGDSSLNELFEWPLAVAGDTQAASVRLLRGLAHADAQLLLDELAGRMRSCEVRNPIGYLSELVSRFKASKFTPELAIQVREQRIQRVRNSAALQLAESRAVERLMEPRKHNVQRSKRPVTKQVDERLDALRKAARSPLS